MTNTDKKLGGLFRTAEGKEGSCRYLKSDGTGKRKRNDTRNAEGKKAAVENTVDVVREEETIRTT